MLLVTTAQAYAQKEFKIAKNSGKLAINNISNLTVQGYDGKEIKFTITGGEKKENYDPRAAGLSALSSSGFDNTDIGLIVKENGQVIEVSPAEKLESKQVNVLIPNKMLLSIKTTGLAMSDSTIIKVHDVKTEVDISTQYEHISLVNVTGPVSAKTLHGNIEGLFTPSLKGPISLVSVYGFVDVALPDNTKADLAINTRYGTLYASKDLNLAMDEPQPKEKSVLAVVPGGKVEGKNFQIVTMGDSLTVKTALAEGVKTRTITSSKAPVAVTDNGVVIVNGQKAKTAIAPDYTYSYSTNFFNSNSGTTINGKLNGGGEKIILKSTYGKIYLRK